MLRRMDEQGRIVKGVNTTVDVDTNEIIKQAKKSRNTVDKDGRPPTLSKKVLTIQHKRSIILEWLKNPLTKLPKIVYTTTIC